jgi:hypothetical protein
VDLRNKCWYSCSFCWSGYQHTATSAAAAAVHAAGGCGTLLSSLLGRSGAATGLLGAMVAISPLFHILWTAYVYSALSQGSACSSTFRAASTRVSPGCGFGSDMLHAVRFDVLCRLSRACALQQQSVVSGLQTI